MPIAAVIGLSGTPAAATEGGTMLGAVTGGTANNTLIGTVSTTFVAAWTSDGLYSYYRLKIDGEWVPESDLEGLLTMTETLDRPGMTITFGLIGKQYSHFNTENTFTRTPLEVHLYQGNSPNSPLEEVITGYVLYGTQAGVGPVIQVTAGDEVSYFEKSDLCLERAPFITNTRGSLLTTMGSLAGLAVSAPDGAVYDKPIQASGVRLLSYMADFAEPEGWKSRMEGSTLTFFEPVLKESPLPPDWQWTPDDWMEFNSEPPAPAPSRWVVRGDGVITIDEAGTETHLTVSETTAEFAPRVATDQQQTNGSVTSTGFTSTSAVRVQKRVEDEVSIQGGRLIRQEIREHGWKNPRAAKLVTNTSGGGSYDYRLVYLDEDGEFVAWPRERLVLTSRRLITPGYNTNWDEITRLEQLWTHYLRTKGVATYPNTNTTPDVASSYVYGDNHSYATESEEFGLASENQITYHFNEAGRNVRAIGDQFGWYSPASRIDSGSYYTLYDGTGQADLTATWRWVGRRDKNLLLRDDASTKGEGESLYGYRSTKRKNGQYDWGEHNSDMQEEKFGFIQHDAKGYDVLSEDQLRVIEYPAGGGRSETTVIGKLPLPIFASSLWTRTIKDPFEVVLDDPTAEEWWGFSRSVVENEFLQSSEEAWSHLNRLRRDAMSDSISITRRDHPARTGDTLLLMDPTQGLWSRALIWEKKRTRNLANGSATAAFGLKRYRV